MYRINPNVEVSAELIQNLIEHFRLHNMPRLQRLGDYYVGNHDILKREFSDPSKPNNKIVNQYPKYITDVAVGYFAGSPVSYGSEIDEHMARLQAVLDSNSDSSHNMELSKQISIYGVGYELIYMNTVSEIKYTLLESDSTFVVYDNTVEAHPMFAVRFMDELDYVTNESVTSAEVFTKNEIINYTFGDDGLVETDRIEHFFNDVPVIEYKNNAERLGDFEPVLSLVNAYDLAVSDTANEINYFSDAYLVLKGLDDIENADIQNMKQQRVMVVPQDADAKFLVKDSDYQSVEVYKTRLREDIHKFSMTPDLTDTNFSQNASGVSIKYKLFGLDNVAVTKEHMFRSSLKKRVKLITEMLNIKGGNYNYNDIFFTFSRNIPQDNEALIKMAKELVGLVSHETALSALPSNIVDDVAYEMNKLNEEKVNPSSMYGNLTNE